MRVFCALILWVLAVQAQAQTVDYAAIFAAHEAEVQPGGELDGRAVDLLTLPEGIELRRLTGPNGEVTFTGIDSSGNGAVGCLYETFFELVAMGRFCPWTPPKADAVVLEDRLRRIARFVLENGVPAEDPETAESVIEAGMARWQREFGTQVCAEPDYGLQGFAGALASDAFGSVLDTALSVPRLPVLEPCL